MDFAATVVEAGTCWRRSSGAEVGTGGDRVSGSDTSSIVAVSGFNAAQRVNRIVVRHGTIGVGTALSEEDAVAVAGAESRVAGVALATLTAGIAAIAVAIASAFGAGAWFVVGTVRVRDTERPAWRTIEVGRTRGAQIFDAAMPPRTARAVGVDAAGAKLQGRIDGRNDLAEAGDAVGVDLAGVPRRA